MQICDELACSPSRGIVTGWGKWFGYRTFRVSSSNLDWLDQKWLRSALERTGLEGLHDHSVLPNVKHQDWGSLGKRRVRTVMEKWPMAEEGCRSLGRRISPSSRREFELLVRAPSTEGHQIAAFTSSTVSFHPTSFLLLAEDTAR
jgi:hypothetical protein